MLRAAARGELDTVGELAWREGAAVVVVSAAAGYPGTPAAGGAIGLPDDEDDAYVLHAGTRLDGDRLVAAGGRVLGTVGRGVDVGEARERAYALRASRAWHYADGFHRAAAQPIRGVPH